MPDPRFARLKTDPRFRRPKKKHAKVVIDGRFKKIFHNETEKHPRRGKANVVDKYGRTISDTQEMDNLRRFYCLEGEDETGQGETKVPDFARGEFLLESSDEEDHEKASQDDNSDTDGIVTFGLHTSRPIPAREDQDAEIDLDESTFADLNAQVAAYAKDHPEGEQEGGERTHRIAVVNLDWDHVRAIHLLKIFSSLVSPTAPAAPSSSSSIYHERQRSFESGKSTVARGKVLSVCVYTSEFGKERLAREEKEGPPAEVFRRRKGDEDEEINENNIYEVGGEDDCDEDALRKYQLERMRYYYAIVTCDTVDAASHIYSELDGTELEYSANVFDLSFVPNQMSFDDTCRDKATEDGNNNYIGVDFVTDALRHSKVKLTWDNDDPERHKITRRALSRQEIEGADFGEYIASSTSGSEADEKQKPKTKKTKDNRAARDKLRALLLGSGNDELPEGWGRGDRDDTGDGVDMEVTFTPGLSEAKEGDETTLEKYQRKMKDKRKKRREELKGNVVERENDRNAKIDDDFFDEGSLEEGVVGRSGEGYSKGKSTGVKGRKAHESSSRLLTTPEELALLVASDNPHKEPKHFNLNSVLKSEKKSKGRRRKGMKTTNEDNETQEDFAIDVQDERFKALHEDHAFAIDPSNPHFKKTKSMAALLEERSKRQNQACSVDLEPVEMTRPSRNGERSLKSLVESVKRKSAAVEQPGTGKRRKL